MPQMQPYKEKKNILLQRSKNLCASTIGLQFFEETELESMSLRALLTWQAVLSVSLHTSWSSEQLRGLLWKLCFPDETQGSYFPRDVIRRWWRSGLNPCVRLWIPGFVPAPGRLLAEQRAWGWVEGPVYDGIRASGPGPSVTHPYPFFSGFNLRCCGLV